MLTIPPTLQVGSEKLNQYVNSYLTRLIDAVSAHGGDVIKFAGDALQVVYYDTIRYDTLTSFFLTY